MARLGRYFLADQPLHVIQRGNNREPVFFTDDDYRFYLQILGEAAERAGVRLHAYLLMTNHVHLLVTPMEEAGIPQLMQMLGTRYVRHVNLVYRRTGTLWEGRYRAARSRPMRICFRACATSNSIRCGRGCAPRRETIPGRATAVMPAAPRIRC